MGLAIILFVVYFGAMLAIGPIAAKRMKKRDSSDFILAGRAVPMWLVVGGIVATLINSATLLGYGGSGYSLGISGYFASLGFLVILMWSGYWFIPRLRRANITTIPELFEKFFGWPHRVVAVILVVCRDLGVTAGSAIGMAVVFKTVFDIPLDVALLITLGVTLAFTVLGGMWAVMITDTIQAAMILIGTTLMIPLGIAYIGGWDAFVNLIPDTHTNVLNAGMSQTVGWIISGALTCAGYQTMLQRGLSAESDEVAKKSFFYGGITAIVWYMVPFITGILALVIFPDILPSDAFLQMTTLFGSFGSIIFAIIIVASCISTLSSTILTTASNISLDIYKRLINPNATDRQILNVTKVSVVVVAIIGTLIGRSIPYILELLLTGGRIMAASLAPVLLAIVFWKASRTAYYSSIIAMILGAITTIYGIILGNSAASSGEGGVVFVWALDPVLMGLPVTLLVLIIGTFIENRYKANKALNEDIALGE
ncbi:sodium:solute symporter family transporter [Fredinandcohnia sp. FSL W7-1320]|uniref:sodium:solute symporter family transporter n=1 Tax=Fredinandcohnia sp. FSL W7-1320 TaxID=2954540 RepID=UPI000EAF81CF